jgi:hypothetical protein
MLTQDTERASRNKLPLPILQPRELNHGEARQKGWYRGTIVQSMRAVVPKRHQLWVRT